MENTVNNKMLIRVILKQSITSEAEFNWFMTHLNVDQLIELFRIDVSKLNLDYLFLVAKKDIGLVNYIFLLNYNTLDVICQGVIERFLFFERKIA